MKPTWSSAARVFSFALISYASIAQPLTATPASATQSVTVPDRFRHAQEFIRTLEASGLVVQSVAQSKLEAYFGGGQNAAFITTDKGVVEVVVLPGPLDAEQLSITYMKWNGNGHHYRIEGPSIRAPENIYGSRVAYFTLHKNWFIQTYEPELDRTLKRILGQFGR